MNFFLKRFIKKLDKFLDNHTPLLLLLALLILLRIPNLFEPYWYGDEGIYLTVGQGIRYGQKLYTEIVDHKTPIIYYLATVPNQFWFRILNIGWMTVSTILFYQIAKKLLAKPFPILSGIVFVVLTSLPWFEGNIPNGELFVIGFVLAGLWLITQTDLITWFDKKKQWEFNLKTYLLLFAAGIFVGLGILTKVPALLDWGGLMLIGWFYWCQQIFSLNSQAKQKRKKGNSSFNFDKLLPELISRIKKQVNLLSKNLKQQLIPATVRFIQFQIPLFLGVITPIIISVIYFVSQGSGQDYLRFGLLYNFHYAQSWQPSFSSVLTSFLFTLPGKTVVLAVIIVSLSILSTKLSKKFRFFMGWLMLTIFASLLSNRPYPHYFQQLVPPFALLIGYLASKVGSAFSSKSARNRSKNTSIQLILTEISYALGVCMLVVIVALALDFKPYPTAAYYQRFWQFLTGNINQQTYQGQFDRLVLENQQVAQIIQQQGDKQIFIWGTNPMLYAKSKTIPTGRFTVSFHIKDVDAYDSTYQNLVADQPEIIVVMKNETGRFPQFYNYLHQYYYPNYDFEHMVVYLRNGDE